MSISIAEYLGIDVAASASQIVPIRCSKDRQNPLKPDVSCPFKSGNCVKASKGEKPICSVRDGDGKLWIVCEHRLCATSPKASLLNTYQADVLHKIAQKVYGNDIPRADVLVKREETIPVTGGSSYKADYVMWRLNPNFHSPTNQDKAIILEMQGGGETSNTGEMTRLVEDWENSHAPLNNDLMARCSGPSPLVTNAWRRQQEQFLVKGNVAMLTGAKMVFCVGEHIYDYLMGRFRQGILSDLSESNWTLAVIAIEEKEVTDVDQCSVGQSIPLGVSQDKIIYTNYASFVQVLTNQSEPKPDIFCGEYRSLSNDTHEVEC